MDFTMKRLMVGVAALLVAASWLPGQMRQRPQEEEKDIRLPSGKMQREEILKADYQRTLQDAGELLKLAEELKIELEKNDRHVLSLGMLKKTEQIEKLAKQIRQRMKRF